jgi:hypothetical protein
LNAGEIYDPATGLFTMTDPLATARFDASATLLADGRVLVVGGTTTLPQSPWHQDLTSAEIFNPLTEQFAPTGSLHTAHTLQSATLLADGQVLVLGGVGSDTSTSTWDAELYNPTTGKFTVITPSLVSNLDGAPGVTLDDGRILSLGYTADDAYGDLRGQLYDPKTGKFSLLPDGPALLSMSAVATKLANGDVLIISGEAALMNDPAGNLEEIYHPATNTYTATGPLSEAELFNTLITLKSGRVLLTSGESVVGAGGPSFFPNGHNEIYDDCLLSQWS